MTGTNRRPVPHPRSELLIHFKILNKTGWTYTTISDEDNWEKK
jgi:hypothetical protein